MKKTQNEKQKNSVEERRATLIRRINLVTLITSIVLMVVVLFLLFVDGLGGSFLDEAQQSHLRNWLIVAVITLFLSALSFAASLLVERKMFGLKIVKFKDINVAMKYIIDEVNSAETVIRDLTWLDSEIGRPARQVNIPAKNNLEIELFDAIIKRSKEKSVAYHQVFTFTKTDKPKSDGRFKAMKKAIETYSKDSTICDLYSCFHYVTGNLGETAKGKERTFPKIQFMLIDDKTVIFTSRRYNGNLCAIKEKSIVNIFVDYCNWAEEYGVLIYDKSCGMTAKETDNIIKELEKSITIVKA